MRQLILAAAFVFVAASAHAQSPYVAATIGADLTRAGRTESTFGGRSFSGDSEVVAGSLRVGTSVGQNWGVELEFVKAARARGSMDPFVQPLADVGPFAGSAFGIPGGIPSITIIGFQTDIRQSHYDFDPMVWVRQPAGGRVDLIYLGGVAFSHRRTEISQTFPTGLRGLPPVPAGGFRTTVVTYSTRPVVGAEARITLTSHMRLIPGLRVQGLDNAWLVRPYAGLGWFF